MAAEGRTRGRRCRCCRGGEHVILVDTGDGDGAIPLCVVCADEEHDEEAFVRGEWPCRPKLERAGGRA